MLKNKGIANCRKIPMGHLTSFAFVIAAVFGSFFAAASAGQFIDSLMRDEHKIILSNYIFADRSTSLSDFESSTINGLVNIFLHQDGSDHISPRRVIMLTSIVPLLSSIVVIYFSFNDPALGYWQRLFMPVIVTIGYTLFNIYFGFPGDYLSIYVTKWLFYKKDYRLRYLPVLWFFDIVLSMIPILFIIMITIVSIEIYIRKSPNSSTMGGFVLFACAGTFMTTMFISVVQAIIITSGLFLRSILKITPILFILRQKSKVGEHPVAVCFAVTAAAGNLFFGLLSFLLT
jgi:hypothetical protein